MRLSYSLIAALAASSLLAACGPNRSASDVTRFHVAAPARGAVLLTPAEGHDAESLEYQNYARAVGDALSNAGFKVVSAREEANYLGRIDFGQRVREGAPKSSPFRIGIGGGTAGRNVGVGVGTSIGIGGSKASEIVTNQLELRLVGAADDKTLWEGRAVAEVDGDNARAPLSASLPLLASALLRDFPGPSGETVRYKAE